MKSNPTFIEIWVATQMLPNPTVTSENFLISHFAGIFTLGYIAFNDLGHKLHWG
jgi:hypothetical protein